MIFIIFILISELILDKKILKPYNKVMQTHYTEYMSQNGFSFHHSLSINESSTYKAESHERIEIYLLISGHVTYLIEGSVYQISPGDILIVNAKEFHSLTIDPTIAYERIKLHFLPSIIPKLKDIDLSFPFLNARLYSHIIPQKLVAQSKIKDVLRQIKSDCDVDSKYRDSLIISHIVNLITEINITVDTLLTKEIHLIPSPKSSSEILQATINYVNTHVTENIASLDIAQHLGISESYLYRFFKQKMGISLHSYIENQKMQLALSMIRQGYSLQNISDYLGYDYYATFFAQFKRIFGKPPSAF